MHVIVRQVVSSRTKRGVLRTSNRERVTKCIRVSAGRLWESPAVALGGCLTLKMGVVEPLVYMWRLRGCSRVPVHWKRWSALSLSSLGEAQKRSFSEGSSTWIRDEFEEAKLWVKRPFFRRWTSFGSYGVAQAEGLIRVSNPRSFIWERVRSVQFQLHEKSRVW